MEVFQKSNSKLMILCILILLVYQIEDLRSEEDNYVVYSIGISHILNDFEPYQNAKVYICEYFNEVEIHKQFQKSQSKYLKSFSSELAKRFRNNTIIENYVEDKFHIPYDYSFLEKSSFDKYFNIKNNNPWQSFYKDNDRSLIVFLPKIIFNSKKNKAVFLLYVYSSFHGGTINLILAEKRHQNWEIKKTKFVAFVNS